MSKILYDTNLLVYAWDTANLIKQAKAIEIFEMNRKSISLTLQNLSELSAVLLRKQANAMDVAEIINLYTNIVPILVIEPADLFEALRGVNRYRMSFWDAQIWAVARRCGGMTIFTEDGPIGQTIEGVAYVNPLT
jgi:predicted nucleic acid-binding protein